MTKLIIKFSEGFKKSFKKIQNQRKNIDLLFEVIEKLTNEIEL